MSTLLAYRQQQQQHWHRHREDMCPVADGVPAVPADAATERAGLAKAPKQWVGATHAHDTRAAPARQRARRRHKLPTASTGRRKKVVERRPPVMQCSVDPLLTCVERAMGSGVERWWMAVAAWGRRGDGCLGNWAKWSVLVFEASSSSTTTARDDADVQNASSRPYCMPWIVLASLSG